MSKQLVCIVDGCEAVCTGESEEEIMTQAEEHVHDAHPEVTLDEETVQAVKANIEEA